jgi:hypothetical protein
MPDRRSPVMIMADAWWEAPNGSLQKARVRIVNKSVSGACIWSKGTIDVGARLRIQSRWDEFSGVAKYCRSDGTEYLIGIQPETGEYALPKRPAAAVEHVQLKAELEQVQTHYMERMKQKLDSMARDQARFASWLTMKQQEVQSITEAAELCLKAAPPGAAETAPAAAVAPIPAEAKQPVLK